MIRAMQSEDADTDHLKQRIEELSQNPNYELTVYEEDASHEVLGFLQAEKYDLLYGESGYNIIALGVDENMHHKGIGTQLLTFLENKARAQGYAFIRLNCNTIRSGAHAFYEQHLYISDKTQKRYIKSLR